MLDKLSGQDVLLELEPGDEVVVGTVNLEDNTFILIDKMDENC